MSLSSCCPIGGLIRSQQPDYCTRVAGGNSYDQLRKQSKHVVRTTADGSVSATEAIQALALGNERFRTGQPERTHAGFDMRMALVDHGQAPIASVFGCSDSRVPIEILFDSMPGDLFVLRNAGNTCTHAEGSVVASLEFSAGALGTRLIVVVLGHTKCGAITGAVKNYLSKKGQKGNGKADSGKKTSLQLLLDGLCDVVEVAEKELGEGATMDALITRAVRVNVAHTVDFLLKYSQPIRELVKQGKLEIHGAIYHLETGHVEFTGRSENEYQLLNSDALVPPAMAKAS